MDFSLSEEQQAVRDLAREILEDLVTNERLKQLESDPPVFDRRAWEALAEANLLGATLPEAHGGNGLGFVTLCVLLEEVGRTVAPVPVLPTLALGALPLERFGSPLQKERWLPGVARGETILTAAHHEPGNEDSQRPSTEARPEGDGFALHGEKILVPAAGLAERVLVAGSAGDGRVGLFWIDPRAKGVGLDEQQTTDRQPHARLRLDGVRVGPEEVLVAPEAGAEALAWCLERATTAICAVQLGVSERALRMTADYAAERIQFERPIGSFQAVHQRLADAYIGVQAMRLTTWDAAWRLEADEPGADAVAVAKYWAAEAGQQVGYACQHLHGGIGIDVDYPMHRYYLWAKQSELGLGAAPLQLERLGDRLAEGTLAPG